MSIMATLEAPQTEIHDKTLNDVISENIRARCARLDINQSELARRIDKTQGFVAMKWRGKRPWMVEDITAVAEVLGVQPYELLIPDTRGGQEQVRIVKTPPVKTGGGLYTARDSNPEPAD